MRRAVWPCCNSRTPIDPYPAPAKRRGLCPDGTQAGSIPALGKEEMMMRWMVRYWRRKKQLDQRMREFERNGMHATWGALVTRSRWM